MPELPPWDDARIIEAARGIVTNTLLVADHNDRRWQSALALMAAAGAEVPDNAAIALVPVAPHLRGWWQGDVPAVVIEMQIVPRESVPALQAMIDAMNAVLFPEGGS